MKNDHSLPTLDWDAEIADESRTEETFWSETRVLASIREANAKCIDPYTYIQAQKGQRPEVPSRSQQTLLTESEIENTQSRGRFRLWIKRFCF